MLYPTYEVQTPDTLPISHQHDIILDDHSLQMAISQTAGKLHRSSMGQQRAAASMRISKPSSVNNSPGSSSTMANRRRTMMGADVWTPKRQQQVWDYLSIPQQVEGPASQRQPARPLSWHPSSYFHPSQQAIHRQQSQATYPLATPSMYGGPGTTDFYGHLAQVSPIMTSYSSNTSPSSTFSPLPLPSSDYGHFMHTDRWGMHHKSGESSHDEVQGMAEPFPQLNSSTSPKVSSTTSELDWNSFILQGFNTTTPPTPETYLQLQQPAVSETAVPFEPLDEPEEEGEVLVGMGLYDTPDKYDEDPQLNNYRSTVSSLLGSTFRPMEAKGKGLKLEETWEPPKPEDDEEEEEEEEEDEDEE